jgi:NAD dependent epimerase/dehydratase
MRLAGKRVLVTGAGGFIGSHLCEALLEAGSEVTAMLRYSSRSDWGNLEFLAPPHRAALRVVAGTVEDGDFVSRQARQADVIFSLAALIGVPYSYVAPLSYVRTNIEGTLNVLEAARAWGAERVVHTSTSETYGTAVYTPIDEQHPLHGQSPYAASKIGADKLVESYHLSFGLPVVTVRPFNTYGPRQSARAVVPTIISQALAGDEIRLGSLEPVRDLTYVKDVVRGFVQVAEADEALGEVVNLGSGTGVSVGQLAAEILGLVGGDKRIVEDPDRLRPPRSEVLTLICDNRKAAARSGWAPRFGLREGLRETIEFVARAPALYQPARYAV